jgi:branched-chain amino acid transport system permease protein
VLTALPYFLTFLEDYDIIMYGFILMVIMIFMPEGLTRGVVDRVKKRFFV